VNKEEFRAYLENRFGSPIEDPVAELMYYIKKLWGHGETDEEVRTWLQQRGALLFDDRGMEAWEMVLEGNTSDQDLIRLVYAAGQFDLEPLDGSKARHWLTERLEWVRGSF